MTIKVVIDSKPPILAEPEVIEEPEPEVVENSELEPEVKEPLIDSCRSSSRSYHGATMKLVPSLTVMRTSLRLHLRPITDLSTGDITGDQSTHVAMCSLFSFHHG